MNLGMACFSCGKEGYVTTVNKIPICIECKEESQIQYKLYEKNKKSEPEINCIIENKLYLGNYDSAKSIEILKKSGITHILVCGNELECVFHNDFVYEKLDIEDAEEQNLEIFFDKAIEFIDSAKIIYIHCYAGVSRSASITIAYVMNFYKWNFDTAFRYVKEKRPGIYPNQRFICDLKLYEKKILK
jgi:hypothetical protein